MTLTYQPFASVSGIEEVQSSENAPSMKSGWQRMEWPSIIGGAGLTALGIMRRSLPGILTAATGGLLLYFGMRQRMARQREQRGGVAGQSGIRMEDQIEVNAPRDEVFRFWRKLENLPRIMSHLKTVQIVDDRYSRWNVEGPAGSSVEWYAEIINQRENEMIAWKSVPGADCPNAGSVRFEDAAGGGTKIVIKLEYRPPVGQMGHMLATLFGASPERQLTEDLQRFKVQIEGELQERRTVPESVAQEIAAETTGL